MKFLNSRKPPAWMLRIGKRLRFVISVVALTGLMLFSTFFTDIAFIDKALIFTPIFVVAIYFFTYFSILEGIEDTEWITLFLMPLAFTLSAFFFYNLIPIRWLTRIPFIPFYGASIYFILLTSNIFNVGAEKNIQLYRAAFSVNYLYQTIVMFLFFNTLLALSLNFLINAVVAAIIVSPLALQYFWSIKLQMKFNREHILLALLLGLVVGQAALVFSFVPFTQTVLALVLTAVYYSVAGLTYAYLDLRLFKETIREYIIVLVFVLAIGALSIRW